MTLPNLWCWSQIKTPVKLCRKKDRLDAAAPAETGKPKKTRARMRWLAHGKWKTRVASGLVAARFQLVRSACATLDTAITAGPAPFHVTSAGRAARTA